MKKILILILIFLGNTALAINLPFLKKEPPKKSLPSVFAPALEYNLEDYKEYFKKPFDYELNLKSRSDYILTCAAEIMGVVWGDVENIKMSDVEDENGENDLYSVHIKTKYETYSYIRLYNKHNADVANFKVSVNPLFSNDKTLSFGFCTLKPYGR